MNRMLLLLVLWAIPFLTQAQLISFIGKVVDGRTQKPLSGVQVITPLDEAFTDVSGQFELELAADIDEVDFRFQQPGYVPYTMTVKVTDMDVKDLGVIELSPDQTPNDLLAKEDQIPTIVISDDDLESEQNTSDISGLLTASRDVFVSAAAYTFGPARFRFRGLDSENTLVFINGVPMNELENGRVYWSAWGGLNDVMRNRQTDIGLGMMDYTIGGVGGATMIDTRASNQRKQLRASYAVSNRTYTNRLMLTYSTGLLKNDWAFSFSGSRRWAEEGFVEGTFYDAWAYFLSVDKKLSDKHSLNLTALGAPSRRGRSSGAIQEIYDLANTNYYNSYWGYQNGEKRNSRVSDRHQPLIILRHDWDLSSDANLTTAVSYQFGKNGSSAIDWYDARDPRPNYYRYLPSYVEDPLLKEQVTAAWRTDETVRQLDWDYMYNVNALSFETIENANGIEGNTISGRRSKYIVEDRRYDSREFNFNTIYQNYLNENISVQSGLGYQYYQGSTFKEVNDLLGGEFYVDINRFAEFDFPNDPEAVQNDLENPNRILEVGDRFGWDYDSNIRKGYGWLQGNFSYRKVDFFLSGELSRTSLWRSGNVRNGLFPDNSFGDSEKQQFTNYGLKGGLTYKFDNRNYLFLNAAAMTRAPFFRNSFYSPRTRNQVVEGLTSEKIQSVEAGYLLRSPNLKARASVYYAQFRDQTRTINFYNDEDIVDEDGGDAIRLGFVNYVLTGIDKRHLGTELALEWKVNSALSLNGVAAIGQYIYNSRPEATILNDNNPDIAIRDRVIYQENFRIGGTPQTAYTAGINYRGKQFWFANLNFNYFDNVWLDFNPNRRTESAIADVTEGSDQWENVLFQEKVDPAFTVDFFGGKSFKFGDVFLYLNVGVSNILDNRDFITGGYEQLRFDFESKDPSRFPSRYFYYFGRTYFINLSLRL